MTSEFYLKGAADKKDTCMGDDNVILILIKFDFISAIADFCLAKFTKMINIF